MRKLCRIFGFSVAKQLLSGTFLVTKKVMDHRMDNRTLVEQAKEGDQIAFAELVARYQKVAITKAWRLVRDFHLAQDIAQTAFITAYQRLPTLENPAAFGPWLLEIVKRQSLKAAQRQKDFQSLEACYEIADSDPLHWQNRHAMVIDALSKLPEHEEEVIVLFYLENHPAKKVAELLDRPVGTVTKQVSRAIARLRTLIVESSNER